MQARDHAELAHHEHGIKFRQDIYNEFGPQSEKGKAIDPTDPKRTGETKDFAKQVWAEAVHRNDGKDPLNRKDTYTPTTRDHKLTKELEWLRGIRDAKDGEGLKRLAVAHSAEINAPKDAPKEAPVREGDNGGPPLEDAEPATSMASLAAETKRIEGDIALRPTLPADAMDTQLTKSQQGVEKGRIEMEPWSDPDQLESKVFGEQQTKLRDWINDLDDTDYRLLTGKHEDLATNVRTTQVPDKLLEKFQQDLAKAQARRPKGEITTEVELPPARENLPTIEGPPAKETTIPRYETEAEAVRAKTERLRALRLANAKGGAKRRPLVLRWPSA
jgi:hypothetical protein